MKRQISQHCYFVWSCMLACILLSQHSRAQDHLQYFVASQDVTVQKQALLTLLDHVGSSADIAFTNSTLTELGYPGLTAWNTADVSYCMWWGVTCCGHTLTVAVPVCQAGNQSISALELPAVGLAGQLPDVFEQLPDLQLLDLSYNRGLRGTLPNSLGKLMKLWQLNVKGTSMRCNASSASPPPCPLPDWLQHKDQFYYDQSGLECPVISFVTARNTSDALAKVYSGAATPEVTIDNLYFDETQCKAWRPGEGSLLAGSVHDGALPYAVHVILILVPSLTIAIGLVLLSATVLRYLRFLKRSHDAINLTESWKRRNPPGVISHGNDRVLREVTLVVTDVEGSTELWEWDYAVMTLAQEVHDSVMRNLIGRYCGYEVTTEGDSFTIAFHDAFDAVCWSLAMQQAMLEADWPELLLSHEKASVVYSSSTDSSRPGQLLFRGLRVRVAINTGIPTMVHEHELTNTLVYVGPVTELVTTLSELPAGGQVLLGPQSFSSIAARLAELGEKLMLTDKEACTTIGNRLKHCQESNVPQAPSVDVVEERVNSMPSFYNFQQQWQGHAVAHRQLEHAAECSGSGDLAKCNRLFSFGSDALRHMRGSKEQENLDVEAAASATRWGKSTLGRTRSHPSTMLAIRDNEHIPMVIDLGSHWLDGARAAGSSAVALHGIRLTQVITRKLAPRAVHFQTLGTPKQLSPSYFQAPSACQSLLPDGLLFKRNMLPVVTMAFCAPEGMRQLEAYSNRAAKQALEMFCSAVRTILSACKGYECQEKEGIFMLAFDDTAAALEWACILHLSLLCVHWAPEVLASPVGKEVYGEGGELLYRGVRARVGIYKGDITRIIPHRATGRADYFGPPVNRAARFLSAAAPGEVLAERGLVEECVAAWNSKDKQSNLLLRAMQLRASNNDSFVSRHISSSGVSHHESITDAADAAVTAADAADAAAIVAQLNSPQKVTEAGSQLAQHSNSSSTAGGSMQQQQQHEGLPEVSIESQISADDSLQSHLQKQGSAATSLQGINVGGLTKHATGSSDGTNSFSFDGQSALAVDSRQESCTFLAKPHQQHSNLATAGPALSRFGSADHSAAIERFVRLPTLTDAALARATTDTNPGESTCGSNRSSAGDSCGSMHRCGPDASTSSTVQASEDRLQQQEQQHTQCTLSTVQSGYGEHSTSVASSSSGAFGLLKVRSLPGSSTSLPTLFESQERQQKQLQWKVQQEQDTDERVTVAAAASGISGAVQVRPPLSPQPRTGKEVRTQQRSKALKHSDSLALEMYAGFDDASSASGLEDHEDENNNSERAGDMKKQQTIGTGRLHNFLQRTSLPTTPAGRCETGGVPRSARASRGDSVISSSSAAALSRGGGVYQGSATSPRGGSSSGQAPGPAVPATCAAIEASIQHESKLLPTSGMLAVLLNSFRLDEGNNSLDIRGSSTGARAQRCRRSSGSIMGEYNHDYILYSGSATPVSPLSPCAATSTAASAVLQKRTGLTSAGRSAASSRRASWSIMGQQQQQQHFALLRQPRGPSFAGSRRLSASDSQQLRVQMAKEQQAPGGVYDNTAREQQTLASDALTSAVQQAHMPIDKDSLLIQLISPRSTHSQTGAVRNVSSQINSSAAGGGPQIAGQLLSPQRATYSSNGTAATMRRDTVESVQMYSLGRYSRSFPPAAALHYTVDGQASASGTAGGNGSYVVEGLTGALPLEALSALKLHKMSKQQSFFLQALKEQQAQRLTATGHMPLQIEVHDQGTWSFKGISGTHSVVLVLPSRLAGRLQHTAPKKSNKATCVQPGAGLLHELWVDVVNLDTILLDPGVLLSPGAGGASSILGRMSMPL